MRRITALLLLFPMLHLAIASGDLACATHGATGSPTVATHHHGMPESDSPTGHPSSTPPKPECPTPADAHCCDALAGCALSVSFERIVETTSSVMIAELLPPFEPGAPRSTTRGPEPPPPKA